MSELTRSLPERSASPASPKPELGLHYGSNIGRYADLSMGEARTDNGTPSAVQKLIGMLSSVRNVADDGILVSAELDVSPVQKRLCAQLIASLDQSKSKEDCADEGEFRESFDDDDDDKLAKRRARVGADKGEFRKSFDDDDDDELAKRRARVVALRKRVGAQRAERQREAMLCRWREEALLEAEEELLSAVRIGRGAAPLLGTYGPAVVVHGLRA